MHTQVAERVPTEWTRDTGDASVLAESEDGSCWELEPRIWSITILDKVLVHGEEGGNVICDALFSVFHPKR